MKRIMVSIMLSFMSLSIGGCGAASSGIPQSEYDAVVEERNAIQSELDNLKENTVSKDEYDSIVKERDDLQKKVDKYKNKEDEAKATAKALKKAKQAQLANGLTEGDSFVANGLRITIDKIDLEYWTYNEYYDSRVYGHGQKYVGIDFSVENIGTTEEGIYTTDFKCYADDALCNNTAFYTGEFGYISPGRKTSFSEYWEVPEEAETIEVEYSYSENFVDKMVMIKLK